MAMQIDQFTKLSPVTTFAKTTCTSDIKFLLSDLKF